MATLPALDNPDNESARLDALRGSPAAGIPPATASADPLRPGRGVLIVDDEPFMRSFVSLASQQLGYEVFTASHGAEALEMLKKNPGRIGLVLTDVNMPVMNGLELVRALKSQPLAPPVVVMSGNFAPKILAALKAEGVTRLMDKPFTIDQLRTVFLQVLDPAG